MFRVIAALALASAASLASAATQNVSTLDSTAPWWERVTVTVSGDGHPQACRLNRACDQAPARHATWSPARAPRPSCRMAARRTNIPASPSSAGSAPAGIPKRPKLPAGDMLLARQVMTLAIGAKGRVQGCEIVSASGDMQPQYGCKEASAERFAASASTAGTAAAPGVYDDPGVRPFRARV